MAQNKRIINVLLADDHHLVRDGIKYLIAKYPEFNVLGEGADGTEIIKILESTDQSVDVVLADINMPNMSGLVLSEKIRTQFPCTKVIILSMLDHEKYVSHAMQAGAMGYLLKSVNEEELIFAIKQVVNNSFYACSELTYQLLNKNLLSKSGIRTHTCTGVKVDFSSREVEILELIAEGYTNLEIAEKLFTSKRTVEGHRLQMISKTGVRNTAALVKFCITNGILNYS